MRDRPSSARRTFTWSPTYRFLCSSEGDAAARAATKAADDVSRRQAAAGGMGRRQRGHLGHVLSCVFSPPLAPRDAGFVQQPFGFLESWGPRRNFETVRAF